MIYLIQTLLQHRTTLVIRMAVFPFLLFPCATKLTLRRNTYYQHGQNQPLHLIQLVRNLTIFYTPSQHDSSSCQLRLLKYETDASAPNNVMVAL